MVNPLTKEARMSLFRAIASAFLILVLLSGVSSGQTKPKVTDLGIPEPKSTIYIGNSFFYYNNSMHSHVTALARAGDPTSKGSYRATSVTISGSGFDRHDVETYFRPNAIGRYSFDENNNINFNRVNRLFDVAITMDC